MTQFYLGIKRVEAWPQERQGSLGYAIKYPDGYVSWSPKAAFEKAYLPMGTLPAMTAIGAQVNSNKITPQMVEDFIIDYESRKLGQKTTVVIALCRNGFEVTESASCVDPKIYDHTIGVDLCKKRIKDKVWAHLGFLLQSALSGVNVGGSLAPKSDPVGVGPGGYNPDNDPAVTGTGRLFAPPAQTGANTIIQAGPSISAMSEAEVQSLAQAQRTYTSVPDPQPADINSRLFGSGDNVGTEMGT